MGYCSARPETEERSRYALLRGLRKDKHGRRNQRPRHGGLFVCCEATCPFEDQTVRNYGSTTSFGKAHTVHLRLLREEPNDEGHANTTR